MTHELSWLHISDLHIKKGDSFDRDLVTRAFLTSLPDLLNRGHAPDLVFFTGDLANTGAQDEYAGATTFFDSVLAALKLDRRRLIVVPGNHDVDRGKITGLQRSLASEAESQTYFSTPELLHLRQHQAAFKEWYDNYFLGFRQYDISTTCGPFEYFEINGVSVGVLPINTATFALGDDDHGKLWVGRRCLTKAVDAVTTNLDVTFALMHHPMDWLHEAERAQITTAMQTRFDLILSGHLHQPDMHSFAGNSGNVIRLAAGASYQGSQFPNRSTFAKLHNRGLTITPIRYDDSPSPVWTLDTSIFPQSPDYSGKFELAKTAPFVNAAGLTITDAPSEPVWPVLEHPQTAADRGSMIPGQGTTSAAERSALEDFERDLFLTPGGRILYVEPRLAAVAQNGVAADDQADAFKTVADLVGAADALAISVPSEYGGTSLSKRLKLEFVKRKEFAYLADANSLPNYRAKLKDVFKDVGIDGERLRVIILDNFDRLRHEKLLKEIDSLGIFNRVILIVTIRRGISDASSDTFAGMEVTPIFMWSLGLPEIRNLANTLFDSGDIEYISAVVSKIYNDLLALSIPLTPSNVIMYLKVLLQEGDFHPFNRVDIVNKYLHNALVNSSELLADSFSSREKLDILSEFANSLFEQSAGWFHDADWFGFCNAYMKETLTSFSAKQLLVALEEGRIILRFGDRLYFKYSFYFSFLVGRHIANKPKLIEEFLSNDARYSLDGVIEALAGICADGTPILERIVSDLEEKIEAFSEEYIPQEFDPLMGVEWAIAGDEELVWEKISLEIEKGPVPAQELDLIRTSLRAEALSRDQEIRYERLQQLKVDVFRNSRMLGDALKACHGVKGDLKKRALMAFLKTQLMSLQIGAILAPEIAKHEWVSWGGILFLGFRAAVASERDEKVAAYRIIGYLPGSVAAKVGEEIGSRRLGDVVKAITPELEPEGFLSVLAVACLCASKPANWETAVAERITKIGRKSFYLSRMLALLIREFKVGVNTQADREGIKRLIALVQAKRSRKKVAPGAKLVDRILKTLEDKGTFAEQDET